MENPKDLTPESPNQDLLRRVAARFISGLRLVKNQLQGADLNPHEGRIRDSAMPEKYMNIPDYPPEDNDVH